MTLLLIQYNNYYNRIVKKEENLSDYITGRNFKFIERQNFNPNDNVNTEHIINWSEGWTPDYCIIVDENNEIVSRWFITESSRTRGMQYRISLYRDVIVDYYENVVNAPCFVEKGEVSLDNPLIFNKEDFFSNQIKKNESLICDRTGVSWLVMYYNQSKKNELVGTNLPLDEYAYINIDSTAAEWYSDYQASGYKLAIQKQFKVIVKVGAYFRERYLLSESCNLLADEGYENGIVQSNLAYQSTSTRVTGEALEEVLQSNKTAIETAFGSSYSEADAFSTISYFNGKIIKDTNNKFYKVSFIPDTTRANTVVINTINSGNVFNAISAAFYTGGQLKPKWSGTLQNAVQDRITYQYFKLSLTEVENVGETISFNFANIRDLVDQPYGIIALPYKSANENLRIGYFRNALTAGAVDERVARVIMKELTQNGVGSQKIIYDVQLLPYCPVTDIGSRDTAVYRYLTLEQANPAGYDYINNGDNEKIGIVVFPEFAKFTTNITKVVNVPTDNKEFKVNAQCDFYRLCSPNYNGIYEFSSEMNNGIKYFNIDCTYKPYQPYIHVNPDFKGLYGTDFNDPRGLICGGDFSVTIVTDAFESYKLQNKNYQEIFNRQIENLEVNNSIAMTQAKWGVAGGSVGGAGAGAIAGAKFGPYGAAAGAVIGGGASLAGGVADIGLLKKSQAEQLDYYTDVHNMNLQNIRALPDSLTKVDAFNNNNKIFPVLEYYSCTDAEKAVFRNKLTYEGMTVNAIGTIADYIGINQTFIKGQIIRLENLDEDNHMATTIYAEIAKGVYF